MASIFDEILHVIDINSVRVFKFKIYLPIVVSVVDFHKINSLLD